MSPVVHPDQPVMIHNTEARTKQPFEPVEPGKVGIYNCGPTVYDYFHVGNARNFVCADVVRRYFAWRGFDVTFVQNITDIDDKIIQRASERGTTADAIAEEFTGVFFESSDKLGVNRADHHPCATKYVGKMIGMMKRLENAGYTYTADGDLYFRVEKFAHYGKLSGRKLEDQKSGARVEISEKKEHPADFVLWKAAKEGEPSWPSPWGEGRPGWHSECCVMSTDLLGKQFDIHMGGVDLVFPHHENEVAQNEALLGKPFVRYWMHNGFLNVDGEKMSKSLGNFFTIDEVLDKFPAYVVRYFLLSAHYRASLDFSDTALAEAAKSLDRLREARATVRRLAPGQDGDVAHKAARPVYEKFQAAMDDDFNTARGLAALFDAATQINQIGNRATRGETLGADDLDTLAALGAAMDEVGGGVLGIELEAAHADIAHLRDGIAALVARIADDPATQDGLVKDALDAIADDAEADALLDGLIAVRAAARKEKNWAMADRVRDDLTEIGFELLDRPEGTEWKRKG